MPDEVYYGASSSSISGPTRHIEPLQLGENQMRSELRPGIFLSVDYSTNNRLYLKWICSNEKCAHENTVETTDYPIKCQMCGDVITHDDIEEACGSQGRFFTNLGEMNMVGVTFKNEDGRNRQTLIHTLPQSAILIVLPEPDNPADKEAVAVYYRDQRLGFLPKGYCKTHNLNPNWIFITSWERIGGGERTNYGLKLTLKYKIER